MIHITMVGIQIVQFEGTKRTFQVNSHRFWSIRMRILDDTIDKYDSDDSDIGYDDYIKWSFFNIEWIILCWFWRLYFLMW